MTFQFMNFNEKINLKDSLVQHRKLTFLDSMSLNGHII